MSAAHQPVSVAARAGTASPDHAKATPAPTRAGHPDGAAPVDDLIRRSADGHGALMRGDLDRYRSMITLAHDFTLMSPFGGKPTGGAAMTTERLEAIARFFRNGVMRQEVVATYASDDLVVLVVTEWNHAEVGELAAQDWPLRVTLVYRREGPNWHLVHRHADPLVHAISLDQAAALARGNAAQ